MKVNIYLETDKQCQACIQRKYGYVIEIMYRGQIVTREGFGCVVSTYHQCNLQALAEALSRFHSSSEICVHTKDTFVASRVLKISRSGSRWLQRYKGKRYQECGRVENGLWTYQPA
ncbi:MAG: hypothetical protein ACLTER_12640 [Ruminococcus sp.]